MLNDSERAHCFLQNCPSMLFDLLRMVDVEHINAHLVEFPPWFKVLNTKNEKYWTMDDDYRREL